MVNFRRIFGTSRPREERSSAMVLTVTEDTPADMLAGSMELLVQIPRDHHVQTQRVTVQRSTPMMDLLVQIATAHKLTASSYTLQAIGERGLVLPHQPNTPIGALDALQVKLLPKQGTFLARKNRQSNQPFETTFRLQVHMPRNQLYVSRVSPKTNLGEILDEVCREKDLDRNKYELRHPANLAERLDLSRTLGDYELQEVRLYPRGASRGSAHSAGGQLSSQDIMALHKQEEHRRQQRTGVFGFMFKNKSKESSLSSDSLGNRSASPARSDDTARSSSPQPQQMQPPAPPSRPLRKRRPAPKPPTQNNQPTNLSRPKSEGNNSTTTTVADKDKVVISHSRNSSDSSGYHEASVLSDNPDNGGRMPETLPRRGRMQGILEAPRKLAHTSQASKSLGNLAIATSHPTTLTRGISNTSISSTGLRKKRAAPPPPLARPLPSAISAQGLERIVDSDESLTSDMELSKPSSDIDAAATGSSQASSDIVDHSRFPATVDLEPARVDKKELLPIPKPRKTLKPSSVELQAAESSRASAYGSPCPSFGLPSLTEDEREEIALAIDSIVEATNDYQDVISVSEDVFVDAEPCCCADADEKGDCVAHSNGVLSGSEQLGRNDRVKPTELEEKKTVGAEQVPREDEHVDESAVDVEKLACEVVADVIQLSEKFVKPKEYEKEDSVVLENEPNVQATLPETIDAMEPGRQEIITDSFGKPTPPESPKPIEEPPKQVQFYLPTTTEGASKSNLSCAVISMIPKCDHVEAYADDDLSKPELKKRAKPIARSQSETSHFEVGLAEKQAGRHLTSNGEAFTFALNPNLERIEASIHAGSAPGKAAATADPPSDTDVLLQMVSATLSHTLTPPSPPPTPVHDNLEQPKLAAGVHSVASVPTKGLASQETTPYSFSEHCKESINSSSGVEKYMVEPEEEELVTSTNGSGVGNENVTLGSQQDTSDYVSASGEELSIADWEYQIPAPPSAFRDDTDPTPPSATDHEPTLQPIKESTISIEAEIHQRSNYEKVSNITTETIELQKQPNPHPKPSSKYIREQSVERSTTIRPSVDSVDFSHSRVPRVISPQLSSDDTDLKKAEVISELETKISSSKIEPTNSKSVEPLKSELCAPKIAPAENNLSNFTITTYPSQKNLDIFDQMDQQHNDTRVLSTFATLTRGRTSAADYANDRAAGLKSAQSMERVSRPLVDDRAKFGERNDTLREKAVVHRSKSYITLTSNEKFQNRVNEFEKFEKSRDENKVDDNPKFEISDSSKKNTSVVNLNASPSDEIPRRKEQFSQWRDNILRKQEEPTPEKQLQSLQVLKSILPQLKSAQAAAENYNKNSSDTFISNKRQMPPADETRETTSISPSIPTEVKLRSAMNRNVRNEPSKRYTYAGPPAVSLGSWSERPSVNVQIKTDTDYKFGSKGNGTANSASGARTVVSLNAAPEMTDNNESVAQPNPVISNHTVKEPEKEESCVDTSSVNFKDLTKTFGQAEIRLRPKPTMNTRANFQNRHSEYLDRPKQNGFVDSHVTPANNNVGVNHKPNVNGPVPPVKRYTSVVGINNSNNDNSNINGNSFGSKNSNNTSHTNFRFVNGQTKAPPVALKKFSGPQVKEYVVPKPPTMPIITGVTLKSVNARPKSTPAIQQDPRDQLLESIRNFGGREKLKKASEKY